MNNSDIADRIDKLLMAENELNSISAHFEHFASLFDVLQTEIENERKISKEILTGLGLPDANEHVNLTTFRRIIFENLNIDSSFMYKRVFNAADVEQKGYLTPKQLISLLLTLLHGTLEAQVELALRVYGKPTELSLDRPMTSCQSYTITRADAVECIVESLQLSTPRARHTLTTTTREKAHKVGEDLVALIFPKLDADKDGIISYPDFLQACEEDDTLIQVFGQFLPKSKSVYPSRPTTPIASRPGTVERAPSRGAIRPPFENVDYMKHSPTLGLMWGRQTSANMPSGRLEPIPLKNPLVVKKAPPKSPAIKKKKPVITLRRGPVM